MFVIIDDESGKKDEDGERRKRAKSSKSSKRAEERESGSEDEKRRGGRGREMCTNSRRMVEKGSRGESQLLFWHLFSLIDDNANGSFSLAFFCWWWWSIAVARSGSLIFASLAHWRWAGRCCHSFVLIS